MAGYQASFHAGERIYERTNLFVKDVIAILDSGKAVPLGNSGTDNEKCHWLFYADNGDRYFVAVTNENKKLIITVLTRRQHRAIFRNTWAIGDYALQMAKSLWDGTYREPEIAIRSRSISHVTKRRYSVKSGKACVFFEFKYGINDKTTVLSFGMPVFIRDYNSAESHVLIRQRANNGIPKGAIVTRIVVVSGLNGQVETEISPDVLK